MNASPSPDIVAEAFDLGAALGPINPAGTHDLLLEGHPEELWQIYVSSRTGDARAFGVALNRVDRGADEARASVIAFGEGQAGDGAGALTR